MTTNRIGGPRLAAVHAGLALLLALALGSAAAQQAASNAGAAKAAREDLTLDLAHVMAPWTGDLDQMVQRHIVRVLVVPSKTFYFQDGGRQRGVTYEMFRLIEDQLDRELVKSGKLSRKHVKVRFVFVPVRRDQLLPALVAGKGDIAAANLTITGQREAQVDFATPIARDVHEVVVTGPASPALATLDDLSGKEVFVRKSSSYHDSLLALNDRLVAAGRAPVRLKEAPAQLEDEDLLEMLNAGLVGLVVVDRHKADLWARVLPRIKVRAELALRTDGQIAWAVREGSPQLKAFLDRMAVSVTQGSLARDRAAIVTRYLKSTRFVRNAAGESERRRFLALMEFFRKYGDRYDVDWLMMAAQGYQESALNQDARSPVGAIGVMQVMPATGKDMNVGDITLTEPNIHAGVKYMRFVIDNFFAAEPMEPIDRTLFAFASYNAGPGRVASLRKEAARRGLDANVWFQNVEYVAAEKIGRETVTYVSNIYKYYIAYKLMQEAQQERELILKEMRSGGLAPGR